MKGLLLLLMLSVGILGSLEAADTTHVSLSSARAQLSAISAAPGDFPEVHLVVKAVDDSLLPIWDLGIGDLVVQEGEEQVEVVSLRALGDSGAVRLSLALDFSGSMLMDSAMLAAHPELDSVMQRGFWPPSLPPGVRTPLDEAKRAISAFAELHPQEFALLAFNDQVYQVVAMGEGLEPMREAFEVMLPNGGTAMYDAAYAAVEQVAAVQSSGDGGAVILLTDGMDNASGWRLEDVVDLAQNRGIPIFTIGLGQVDRNRLDQLAVETNGRAYFTHQSSELSAIYASIQRELASYYVITYASSLAASASSWPDDASVRFLAIDIVEPTGDLSAEVQAELDDLSLLRNYALPAGLVLATVAAGGIAFAFKRRRQPALRIVRMYPNPVSDALNLELEGQPKRVSIFSTSGHQHFTDAVQEGTNSIDVSGLPPGQYIVRVSDGQGQEVAGQVLVVR